MKKAIVLLSVFAVMVSCQKVLDKISTFEISRTGEFTIPKTSVIGIPITLTTPDITTSYLDDFEAQGFSTDNVEYIKLTKLKLKIKTPAGVDFNFLKDVELSISADGLSDKVLASKINHQNDNSNEMDIDLTQEDFKPFIMKDKFQMKMTAEIDELITQDYLIEATPTFEVKGKLL